MDNAVALVQAYLRLNGYFTVAEYPVLEATRRGDYRAATDLDILAFRFPGAGWQVPRTQKDERDADSILHDPILGIPMGHADMIVGEVKEGRAMLNEAATDPAVLRSVLIRFGCCPEERAHELVRGLLRDGHALLPIGHRIRLVAFGSVVVGTGGGKYTVISLGDVVRFLQAYLHQHWEVLRHASYKDPAFGFLMTLQKAVGGFS